MKHIQYYQDKKKEWRCRIVAKNGRILFVSSESYKTKQSAVKALIAVDKILCCVYNDELTGK